MKPEEAKQLCIEAHKGQFRRPYTLNGNKFISYGEEVKNLPYHDTNWYTLSDGCQIRLNGSQSYREPYSSHPITVADMMTTDEEKIVAYLHDVIEDTNAKLKFNKKDHWIEFNLLNYYISSEIWTALYGITKPNTDADKFKELGNYMHYNGYLKQVSINKIATKVKIADMFHNISSSPSEKQKEKYYKGIKYLLGTL